ncbi:ArsR family transcriptional regulator [Melioribacter roseus P3M-2]|uniref:ArsR family transcriptional regulator n=1 Tax=Melioribacter roseus (strain DSM 23840 / JCM 17771 / VKM B-2668 / P3M-2) TaxID=1191523 RepID=I7A2S5_MELRP|nr:transcriptional regulator [Melioribacter roseus]AFN74231.1 ArsR family transcriptional regulator [Melioribacter roseus P3M-2]
MTDKSGKDFNYQKLDEVIHSRIRLAIMSVLIGLEEAEFNFLKEKVKATDGNLSVHLRKLEDSGYISSKKEFIDRKPKTTYKLTAKGRKAFEAYIEQLEKIIGKK